MELNDDLLNKWENIIDQVNKTDLPLECIKKMVVKLEGNKQKTINIHTMRKQGLEYDEIDLVLARTFTELGDNVREVDYVVDIVAVASLIQPQTDKLLGKL